MKPLQLYAHSFNNREFLHATLREFQNSEHSSNEQKEYMEIQSLVYYQTLENIITSLCSCILYIWENSVLGDTVTLLSFCFPCDIDTMLISASSPIHLTQASLTCLILQPNEGIH